MHDKVSNSHPLDSILLSVSLLAIPSFLNCWLLKKKLSNIDEFDLYL